MNFTLIYTSKANQLLNQGFIFFKIEDKCHNVIQIFTKRKQILIVSTESK